MIDLLNIQPHQVASDIKGYAIGIYGDPGVGKTTLASKAQNSLLIATEAGYKAIPGINAVDVHTWTDVLTVSSQLKKPEVQEKYEVVVIDTLDELVFLAEQHVLNKYGVAKLTDVAWGQAYVELATMFRKLFRDLTRYYGLIVIAHAEIKIDPEDEDNRYATLGINKKVKKIVIGLLDVLAYVESSRDPMQPNIMHFRGAKGWEAKARFANIVPEIEFNYENLVKAITDAVKDIATTDHHKDYYEETAIKITEQEFANLKESTEALAKQIITNDENKMNEVVQLIDITLGKKLSESVFSDAMKIKVLKEELERL